MANSTNGLDGAMMTFDASQLNSVLAEYLLPNTVVLFIYMVVGLLGNITVILMYTYRIKANKDDRFFIPFLAFFDLLACTIGCTFAISLNLLPIQFMSDVKCKVLWYLNMCTTLNATLMLIVIAVQRYLKVCRPFGAQMTLRKKHIALAVVLLTSSVTAVPATFFYGEIEVVNRQTNVTGFRCGRYNSDQLSSYLSAFNIVLLLMAIFGISSITFLYIQVGRSIYRQVNFRQRFRSSAAVPTDKKPESSTPDSGVESDSNPKVSDVFYDANRREVDDALKNDKPDDRKYSKDSMFSDDEHEIALNNSLKKKNMDNQNREIDANRHRGNRKRKGSIFRVKGMDFNTCIRQYKYSFLFMVISSVFILSFTPRMVIMILEAMDKDFWDNLPDSYIRLCLFFYRLYILNNVINPFLYAAFDVRFRQEIKKLCQRS
ncbi:hypothetical protein FSP39_005839 [Pinctada imbricata]|uniref:G-protein coupled receptors family 1 profile domain-containing protein n=1 Tax=Pinctada imbricata TaxID=66713 RepID=A0AA88XL42_PINIB|nr:hypothetical protein FSP39_005839 [Pinctada imbricata]